MPLYRWLSRLGRHSANERALERYYRNEGLRAALESHLLRAGDGAPSTNERILYAAHSYFAS
jgi:hypothetical protein